MAVILLNLCLIGAAILFSTDLNTQQVLCMPIVLKSLSAFMGWRSWKSSFRCGHQIYIMLGQHITDVV